MSAGGSSGRADGMTTQDWDILARKSAQEGKREFLGLVALAILAICSISVTLWALGRIAGGA